MPSDGCCPIQKGISVFMNSSLFPSTHVAERYLAATRGEKLPPISYRYESSSYINNLPVRYTKGVVAKILQD